MWTVYRTTKNRFQKDEKIVPRSKLFFSKREDAEVVYNKLRDIKNKEHASQGRASKLIWRVLGIHKCVVMEGVIEE